MEERVQPASVGLLHIDRRGTWQDPFRSYEIYIDGKLVTRLKRFAHFSVQLPVGVHVCQARIALTGSPPKEVNVVGGSTTNVHIANATGGTLLDRAVSDDGYLVIEVLA